MGDSFIAGVTITLIECVTGERVRLEVEEMRGSSAVPKGTLVLINGTKYNLERDATIVLLKGGRKVYVDNANKWVRETVALIKSLDKGDKNEN